MAHSLRQIKNRIRSIENTSKVTSAMRMISIVKLNRINKMLYAGRPYFSKLQSLLNNLIKNAQGLSYPLFEKRPSQERIVLCLVTSDSGLCGMYNNAVIKMAEEFIENHGRDKIKLVVVGKKGFSYFKKRGINIIKSYIGIYGKYSDEISGEITEILTGLFLSGQADVIYASYTHFKTALIHKPALEKLFELEAKEGEEINYILEPDIKTVLDRLIPMYVSMRIKLILLEAFSCEHASRTVAMNVATENAKGLLKNLTLLRNKVRQASITQDLMEIISSAEALKG